MKRLLVVLLSLAALAALAAEPSDNLQPGGLVLGGSGYVEFYTPQNAATELTLEISPYANMFVLPGFSIGFGGTFTRSSQPDQTTANFPLWVETSYDFYAGCDYYFPIQKRFYISPGAQVGYYNDSGWVLYASAADSPAITWSPYYMLLADVRGLYFVTDRFAPYVGLKGIAYYHPADSAAGTAAKTNIAIRLFFGADFMIPDSEVSIFKH